MEKINFEELFQIVEECNSGFMIKSSMESIEYIRSDCFFDIIPMKDIIEVYYIDEFKENIIIKSKDGCTKELEML